MLTSWIGSIHLETEFNRGYNDQEKISQSAHSIHLTPCVHPALFHRLWVTRANDPLEEYHLGLGGNPVWSPDGKWLAFERFLQAGMPAYMLAEVEVWTPRPLDIGVDRYDQPVDWIRP